MAAGSGYALVLLGVVGVLAVLFPPGIGPIPVAGIEVTRPPWMFWWLYALENWLGLPRIVWGSGALFGLLAAVPFIDRRPKRNWRRRPVAVAAMVLVLAVLVVLSVITITTSAVEHL